MILPFRKNFNLPGTHLHGEPTNFRELILCTFFPQLQLSGRRPKIHTIREDEGGRWRKDRRIDMAYGVRTKQYHQFNTNKEGVPGSGYVIGLDKCTGVQHIEIFVEDKYSLDYPDLWFQMKVIKKSAKAKQGITDYKFYSVEVDGIALDAWQVEQLAFNDGFKSVEDFFTWFSKPFAGKIIHWTGYRYKPGVPDNLTIFDDQDDLPIGLTPYNKDMSKALDTVVTLGTPSETITLAHGTSAADYAKARGIGLGSMKVDTLSVPILHKIIDEVDADSNEYRERNFDCGSDE